MQNAETVLSVLRERGRRGLPCTEMSTTSRARIPASRATWTFSNAPGAPAGRGASSADGWPAETL